jgi:hypothetical protein
MLSQEELSENELLKKRLQEVELYIESAKVTVQASPETETQSLLNIASSLKQRPGRSSKCGYFIAKCGLDTLSNVVIWPLRLIVSACRGALGFLVFMLTASTILLFLYVASQPLLYGSMYHEEFIHKNIALVELVEEGLNTGVQLGNAGIDIVRPVAPLWNFIWYWLRKLSALETRVFIVAIEEIIFFLIDGTNTALSSGLNSFCR